MNKDFFSKQEVIELTTCANGMGRIEGYVIGVASVILTGAIVNYIVNRKAKKEADSE